MDTRLEDKQTIERWGIRFTGIVQGVGFRPLVSMLAHQLSINGFVYNDSSGVYVEAQSDVETLQLFVDSIQEEQPRLCRITHVGITKLDLDDVDDHAEFVIKQSPLEGQVNTFISADTSPCEECLSEMKESGRRYDYPFINCTNCGPRYSIIKSMPYDRERTTMADFTMCEDCHNEYVDVNGRRYHAEPNACAECGPSYQLLDKDGHVCEVQDCFERARELIANGAIIALKGIGGYHLVCDATNDEAVRLLRERKHRKDKPFAIMAGSIDIVEDFAVVNDGDLDVLSDMARPIALLEKIAAPHISISELVAPSNHLIGVMLPYAPVHHVLVPKDAVWVMTSGNASGDSVIYDDEKALSELHSIADYFLTHNRQIYAPVDDSIVSVVENTPILIRRSRGYIPEPIHCESITDLPILAMGSDLKNTFAINKKQEVLLAPHIGDLASESTHETFEWTIKRYEQLFDVKPKAIVMDKHPAFFSSNYGRRLSQTLHVPAIEVQHHHSHIAAVMAEYDLKYPVLGICFDGTGYGDDDTIWGGEFMLCYGAEYMRVAHIHLAPLPGGEKAVKEPWRQALWYLRNYYGDELPNIYKTWLTTLPKGWQILDKALQSDMSMMMTSSAGRLFDTIGCLLGLGNEHSFDAQIAIALESACADEEGRLLDFNYDGQVLDLVPAVQQIMDGYAQGESVFSLAASFHKTLAIAICEVGADLCERYGIDDVCIGGGVFQNRRLLASLQHKWHHGMLYINKKVPCNDGGLSFGQLWIAHQKMK